MKAIDSLHICPYTGLRSFTEEESLYFKGRDLQTDQITALLEQNKFLMVTGASGEGKSSLIYGGLVPNARAGFFKAKYTNWVIADFRPERKPIENMAHALAGHFDTSASTIETELRRGYSSLMDLYLNSSFYVDESGANGQTELERKTSKRNAANLLIIVDQFEEFFTNPENFFNDSPSNDSQVVVNLLLETARVAIKKDLPVYVVCTMRSDYIGQCSAFRGLPEYIGFSQFFVPRLKRKDLKQVIEEPAILSGNQISQRLIERLVFDISEGVDQLPILQHALSRIWEVADRGGEVMDLVHYAMVGGMAEDELPDEDIPRYRNWFSALAENQKAFYAHTGLQKVVEIHANLLYENAWLEYNLSHPESPLTQQEAKRIIALTFSCLTKIDNSRAVRNRMSLKEITEIINRPNLTTKVVGEVLNIFRKEGNSFIRPFITDDPATKEVLPESVLDITHESLIRNWNKLNQWANKEFEYYSTFQDFKKQLDRWNKSGKSRSYLLPIGPLTYFENWYNKCKPNIGWIKRYNDVTADPAQSAREAEETLAATQEFLKKSARKEMITRAFMKYGAGRIATITAILIMIGLTGFYWYDAEQKKNDVVVEKVRREASALMKSPEVDLKTKALHLIAEERFKEGTMLSYLTELSFSDRLPLANKCYEQLLFINKQNPSHLKTDLIGFISKNLEKPETNASIELLLTEGNKFVVLLTMDQYYIPDPKKKEQLTAIANKNYELVSLFVKDRSLVRPLISTQLNLAIQFWLTVGDPAQEKIRNLLTMLSPFVSDQGEQVFNVYYPKGSFETNGRMPSDFNGGYHTLASLYAATGDSAGVIKSFEQLLANDQRNYFELGRVLNNHLNVIGYLYQYGHRDKVPGVLQWLTLQTKDNPPITLLRNIVIRSGYISHLYNLNIDLNFYRSTRGYLFPNLYFIDRGSFTDILEDYENEIRKIKDPSERNFQLAMNSKRKAMFFHKYWYDRKMPVDEAKLDGWLKNAIELYKGIDPTYLEGLQSATVIYNKDGVRTADFKRKDLFLYPDYRDGWFSWSFHSNYFFNYMKKTGTLTELYRTSSDLNLLHNWVAKAFEWKVETSPASYANDFPLPDSTLTAIINFVETHPEGKGFDQNLLRLVLSNMAFERGDTLNGVAQYSKFNKSNILASSNRYEYMEKIFFLNMLNNVSVHLAACGRLAEASSLASSFEENREKAFTYFSIAEKLFKQGADPNAFAFLDSAYAISRRVDFAVEVPRVDPRYRQIQLLSEIGGKAINREADAVLREIPEGGKFVGVYLRVSGLAYEGNYYRALTAIPSSLTESQDLQCRTQILMEACRTKERASGNTQWNLMDYYLNWQFIHTDYLPR